MLIGTSTEIRDKYYEIILYKLKQRICPLFIIYNGDMSSSNV